MIILILKFIFVWQCNLPMARTPPLPSLIPEIIPYPYNTYPLLSKAMTTKVIEKKSGKKKLQRTTTRSVAFPIKRRK